MHIEIDTQGKGTDSKIKINGELYDDLKFFEISINVDFSNKVKVIMIRKIKTEAGVKNIPMEFFGEGVRKFDEAMKMKEGDLNGKFIGSEV